MPLAAVDRVDGVGAALILRGRYDIRGLLLTSTMALRLVGLAVGAPYGVTAAVLGVAGRAGRDDRRRSSASAFAGAAALPAAAPVPLGDDRRPIIRFVLQSSLDTGLDSLRTWIAPLTLGIVRTATDVGLFRGAQAPQYGVRRALGARADDPAHRADAATGRRGRLDDRDRGAAALRDRLGAADGGDPAAGRAARCRGSMPAAARRRLRCPRSARRASCSSRPRSSSCSAGRSRSRSRSAGRACGVVAHARRGGGAAAADRRLRRATGA